MLDHDLANDCRSCSARRRGRCCTCRVVQFSDKRKWRRCASSTDSVVTCSRLTSQQRSGTRTPKLETLLLLGKKAFLLVNAVMHHVDAVAAGTVHKAYTSAIRRGKDVLLHHSTDHAEIDQLLEHERFVRLNQRSDEGIAGREQLRGRRAWSYSAACFNYSRQRPQRIA